VPIGNDQPGAVFEALSDPMRRRLLSQIASHPATATELANDLPITRQAVTKHLTCLSRAGLLARERAGRDVRYRVTPAPLSQAMSWMAQVGAEWDDRLARLTSAMDEVGNRGGAAPT
jgi:DNA-binding transcriptional ArsR family regulator